MRIPDRIINFKRLNEYQITAIVSAVICVFAVLLIIFVPYNLGSVNKSAKIESGYGLNKIATALEEAGIIKNKYVFMVLVEAIGQGSNVKAGRYLFKNYTNMYSVIHKLTAGLAEPTDISVFIPEGYNVWEIDERLTQLGFTKKGDFARRYLDQEGYLFPDTYRVDIENAIYLDSSGALTENKVMDMVTAETIIKKIGDKMAANYNNQTYELLKDLSVKEKKSVMIIASILEKEVRTEEDMQIVSGIIEKRIKKGMPLQLDATVSYGACLRATKSGNNCDVTQIGVAKELKIDSKYNTYTRTGLPAGPISNPGIKAIKAALNPKDSPYLYYLNARDGRTIFSKTGAEHEANRAKYLGL